MKSSSDKQGRQELISPGDLMGLPGKKALEAIMDAPRPAKLVQSLAEEDFYWLVNEIGIHDALPILSLASNDQWQFVLDLEVWTEDRLETDDLNHWLDLLMKADPERFVIWGLRDQTDLMELHLLRHIEVRIREHDEPPSDFADDYFTIDGIYYIRINKEKYEKTTRALLQRLSDHDHQKYQAILLELAGVPPAELEDQLYRLRNVRLAEKGFLPFEEAIGIYQYRNPESLGREEHRLERMPLDEASRRAAPVTASILVRDEDLFYTALQHIDDKPFLERLQRELAAMCNQIVCADSVSVRDKQALAAVVAKACGYLSMGIDSVVGKDPKEARRLVERFSLQEIFRVGFGAALELRWKTEKWFKESWFITQGFDVDFWTPAWAGTLEGLLKKRPLFYTGFTEGEPYREFKTLDEVRHCQQALDQMAAVDEALSLICAQTSIERPNRAYHPMTYQNLLLTGWARHELGLPHECGAISEEDLKAFFEQLWEPKGKEHGLSKNMIRAFRLWLEHRCGLSSEEIEKRLGATVDNLCAELEQDYGAVPPQDLDPRYVKHLLVAP